MKTAVVTLSIAHPINFGWMAAGLPSKKEYARRHGADFINITKRKLGGSVASEKYQIGDMLNDYDRIFYLDADLFIRPDSPNVFDVVGSECFGAYDEGRPVLYDWIKQGWPDDPCQFYVNNGVFVCSREHQWLFDHAGINWKVSTAEQTCMSRRIWEALQQSPPKIKVQWLSQSWNYMPHLYIGGKEPGWIDNIVPDPIWVYHYPCHRPDERVAALTKLNREYGL